MCASLGRGQSWELLNDEGLGPARLSSCSLDGRMHLHLKKKLERLDLRVRLCGELLRARQVVTLATAGSSNLKSQCAFSA